jgi:hypothetical protein
MSSASISPYFFMSICCCRIFQIQDEITGETYYWDGDSVTSYKKPFENIWRVVVVFKPTSKMMDNQSKKDKGHEFRKGEIAAKEFEFGKGDWVDLGIVGLPPRPPAKPGSPKKTTVANLAAKQKPAPSIGSIGKTPSFMDRISIFAGRGGSVPRPDTDTEMLGAEEPGTRSIDGEDRLDVDERVTIKGLGGKSSKSSDNKLRNSISSPRY